MNNGQGPYQPPAPDGQLVPANGIVTWEQYQHNLEQIALVREQLATAEERNHAAYQRYLEQELRAQVEAGKQAECVHTVSGVILVTQYYCRKHLAALRAQRDTESVFCKILECGRFLTFFGLKTAANSCDRETSSACSFYISFGSNTSVCGGYI